MTHKYVKSYTATPKNKTACNCKKVLPKVVLHYILLSNVLIVQTKFMADKFKLTSSYCNNNNHISTVHKEQQ